jgi:Ser/Thr protein kinase RdoA (MazF antagonist)
MANVIYEVMAPDGQTILEIQGPEGAPPEQVQAEAARLYREQLQQRAATTDVPVLDERGQMVLAVSKLPVSNAV